jgi:hypothetical protein
MLEVHGSYYSDYGCFRTIAYISPAAAQAMVKESVEQFGDDWNKDYDDLATFCRVGFINKCFRFMPAVGEQVVAIYNHDGNYRLMQTSIAEYEAACERMGRKPIQVRRH